VASRSDTRESWPPLTSLEAPSSPATDPHDDTLDRRPEAWRANGRERETRTRARVTTIFLVVALTVGAVFFWAATRG
jgi:hypothetical protein